MFIADMDFEMDQKVKEEMLKVCERPDFGYFHISDSFYESIVNWYKDIHYIDIKNEWIVASIGTIISMHLACDMLARDQGVVIMTPVYGPFANCANIGKKFTLPLLYREGRYNIDFEGLEKLFQTQDIKVLLMCNPHNPGGRVWNRDELKKVVQLCKSYQITILSDEIHADIKLSQDFVSLIEFSNEYDQIIVSSSPNKTFNISGLSTSFILSASPQLRQMYSGYLNRLHIGPNRMGINMIEIVYTYGKNWYLELVEVVKKNVEFAINCVKDTEMVVMKPGSGFLLWVYLPKVQNIEQFVLDLARDTHVLLEPGSRFVEKYEGWVRINVGTSPQIVKKAMKKFVDYYQNY